MPAPRFGSLMNYVHAEPIFLALRRSIAALRTDQRDEIQPDVKIERFRCVRQ